MTQDALRRDGADGPIMSLKPVYFFALSDPTSSPGLDTNTAPSASRQVEPIVSSALMVMIKCRTISRHQ